MKAAFRQLFNGTMDMLVRPHARLVGRDVSMFQLWVGAGLLLAVISAIMLVISHGLSVVVMTVIILAFPLAIFLVAMATKIITGVEQHVHYHHAIAIIVATSLVVWVLGQPILPYLDITILGIGLVVTVGRIGCFMVGCCHGRPSRWGVCYRQHHVDAGFVPYYVGVRLCPTQLFESVWMLLILTGGGFFVLRRQAPGDFLVWYVFTYGLGRFLIEFWRGDPGRPYLWGFAEAQWTSLLLMCLASWGERSGVLPFHIWHAGATGILLLAVFVITLKRAFSDKTALRVLYPNHVEEVAQALQVVTGQRAECASASRMSVPSDSDFVPPHLHIACTSLGVQVSASRIKGASDQTYHYSLSHRDGSMSEQTARQLAQLIVELRGERGSTEFLRGKHGVFHLLIHQ